MVDDEDYDLLSSTTWRAALKKNGVCYAVRDVSAAKDPSRPKMLMHRQVLNAQPGTIVDHINRDGLDNRKSNLRFVTNQQNCTNRVGWSGTSSIYKGVTWDKERKKWRAILNYNGTTYRIGRFDSEVAAAKAYDVKAVELCGEFACLNFGLVKVSIQN